MQICHDIVAPPSACGATTSWPDAACRLGALPARHACATVRRALIAGALLICSTVVQSNIQTFFGPNGTEYVVLQWATQLQWQPPPPPAARSAAIKKSGRASRPTDPFGHSLAPATESVLPTDRPAACRVEVPIWVGPTDRPTLFEAA